MTIEEVHSENSRPTNMAITVMNPTFNDVQWLADSSRGEGMVVSCYADTSVLGGVRPFWREHLKNEVKRVDETLTVNPVARRAFHRNIDVIEATLSRPPVTKARGMAVFTAIQRDFVQAYLLAVPVPDRLVIDEEPYLVPLLELLHRQRRYLVVHTDTHHGRLYAAASGAVRVIEEINQNVPRRQRAAGEVWGKQQATIARHREDHVLHFLKELVREIARAWPEERYDGIILLGEHEVLEEIRKRLPMHLAQRVVHEAPHAWVGRQLRLDSKIELIDAEIMREYDRDILENLKRRLLEQHGIATGAQGVIDALRNSQVGYPGAVVMGPDQGDPAYRCAGCRSIFADAHDRCPICQAPCEKSNLWQEIALLAARHSVPVHFVPAGSGLEKHGGVAALLARPEPWAAPAEPLAAH